MESINLSIPFMGYYVILKRWPGAGHYFQFPLWDTNKGTIKIIRF